jgi:perosamine synthetase
LNDNLTDSWKIPLYKIYTDDEDLNLITKIVKRGTYWAIGPEIEEFETMIKNYVGCDYCVTLNSGTSALHATYLAHGISKNNEVIVPSFSFISTANSVLFVDAKPVFADIEDENFGLDPKLLSKKINKKTKAVVPMDYGGLPCKIFDIQKITKDNKLILIEDAAEALGSTVKGKKVGSIADSTIFSFCGNKVLTTGEGGAIVTNSKSICEKIKLIRSHGRADKVAYFNNPSESQYVGLGYNWRMSSITATLGVAQLLKLDKIIQMRQDNAKYISSRISKHKQLKLPFTSSEYENIFQMYTLKLENKKLRDALHKFLISKKIFSKVYFSPIHLTSFYKEKFGTKKGDLPTTEKISDRVLTVPIYPNMTKEEKNYLIESISQFFESEH